MATETLPTTVWVACWCGATGDEPCRTNAGKNCRKPHKDRQLAPVPAIGYLTRADIGIKGKSAGRYGTIITGTRRAYINLLDAEREARGWPRPLRVGKSQSGYGKTDEEAIACLLRLNPGLCLIEETPQNSGPALLKGAEGETE